MEVKKMRWTFCGEAVHSLGAQLGVSECFEKSLAYNAFSTVLRPGLSADMQVCG